MSWTTVGSGGIQTVNKILEVLVYQFTILPAENLAHGWAAEKDFAPGRKDKHDGLAQLGHQEICPTFASRELPWRKNSLLIWL